MRYTHLVSDSDVYTLNQRIRSREMFRSHLSTGDENHGEYKNVRWINYIMQICCIWSTQHWTFYYI